MKDLQFRLWEIGATGGSDSEESIFEELFGLRQWKTKAVSEKSPTEPEEIPEKDLTDGSYE